MLQSEWSTHITALNDSGLSARAYAKQHDLVYSQLIYWKRKLTIDAADAGPGAFVAVKLSSEPSTTTRLGTLAFPTGVQLHIHNPQLLLSVLPYLGVNPVL